MVAYEKNIYWWPSKNPNNNNTLIIHSQWEENLPFFIYKWYGAKLKR